MPKFVLVTLMTGITVFGFYAVLKGDATLSDFIEARKFAK